MYNRHVCVVFGCLLWWVMSATAADIHYRVVFKGLDDNLLRNELRGVSRMIEMTDHPPATDRQLRRRADADVARFLQALKGHGYYEAEVAVEIRPRRRGRVRVRYTFTLGPAYILRHVLIDGIGAASTSLPMEIGLNPGQPVAAREIIAAEDRLAASFRRNGYPFARVASREVRVERAARAVDVSYVVDRGPFARFGSTSFSGLEQVDEPFVRRKVTWHEGEPFNVDQLRQVRRRLIGSDLFTSVSVKETDEVLDHERLPIRVELAERKPRSISFGVGYRSDEGARVQTSWTHRNLFGSGERLGFSVRLAEIGYEGEAYIWKPDWRKLDQDVTLSLRMAREETDAYISKYSGTLLTLKRVIRPSWVVSIGGGFTYADVDEETKSETYSLIYVPLQSEWDKSDDLLDPLRGYRLHLSLTPFWDVHEMAHGFVKSRTGFARYATLSRRRGLSWAGRISAGVISGGSRSTIPADERFYAGGGGTVRGYAFQSVGPLDKKTPLGGNSIFLASSELRWRLSEGFGMVLFADTGTAFENSTFDSGEQMRTGAGLGIRYYTPVGPLRFDLAFPLNRRSEMDDAYQFYISLGQAY